MDNNNLISNEISYENIYEDVFNVASSVIMKIEEKDIMLKILRIIIKLVQNITETEILNENSEKYRKLKIENPNIQMIFKVKEVYDFLIKLGFEEKMIDNNFCLYLNKDKVDIEKYEIVISYLSLLLLSEEEEGCNYYEDINAPFNPDSNQIVNEDKKEDEKVYKKASIVDILKNTKDVRLGKTILVPENYDKVLVTKSNNNNANVISNKNDNSIPQRKQIAIKNPYYKPKDAKTILKETAHIRMNNSNNYHPPDIFNNFISYNNPPPRNNNDNRPKFMTLHDIEYKNPISNINDEIGKFALKLTNDFRAKNKLLPLAWDGEVWQAAYGHSKNMGERKVKFGHDGFNERISHFHFFYSMACENVFMCSGYGGAIADMAVNGWINSPGHRKNMLAANTHCAIATYRNVYGEYYLTQIFVRKGY